MLKTILFWDPPRVVWALFGRKGKRSGWVSIVKGNHQSETTFGIADNSKE